MNTFDIFSTEKRFFLIMIDKELDIASKYKNN